MMEITETLKVHFINDIEEIRKLEEVLKLYGDANGLSQGILNSVNLALEELLSNTIYYGYEDHDEHLIFLELNLEEGVLTATIEDDGIPFNPLEDSPDVDLSKSLEETDIGGLGIHFVKNLMDEVSYQRDEEKNVITLKKGVENHGN